jgi:hypothetical protein
MASKNDICGALKNEIYRVGIATKETPLRGEESIPGTESGIE